MTQRKKTSRMQLGAAIAVTAAATTLAVQPAQANNVIDDIGHFLECFGWMLTDPATQVANCGVGRPEHGLSSLATPVSGPMPTSAPTPTVVQCPT